MSNQKDRARLASLAGSSLRKTARIWLTGCDLYILYPIFSRLCLCMPPLEEKPQQIANRTRLEILASILKVASNGALKTHIMYRANLSHRQLEKYLAFLEETGMLVEHVDEEAGSRTYRVTEKGVGFLREYSHVSSYIAGNPV
jgi:predicted transcriptional regulator